MFGVRSWQYVALLLLVVTCGVLSPLMFGSATQVPDELLQEIVYVDTQTGEAFLLRARSSAEVHPETGDETLVPGLYCERCAAWRAVGSMETLQTGHPAVRCPIHKIPLLRDGPLPDPLE